MTVQKTDFKDLLVLDPRVFEDDRGYFMESYNRRSFAEVGIRIDFVQDNQSRSSTGVLRGLHFQRPPYAQTKLVRALSGEILDVVVDLRRGQPTFGKHFSIRLSSDNRRQLLVPKGFAHGFLVLSAEAEVLYKCDEYYNKDADGGIRFDDPDLEIDWILSPGKFVLSDKDRMLPFLKELNFSF
jgi:dTDP-4-dehydrorhamnose 3,5-epimerase